MCHLLELMGINDILHVLNVQTVSQVGSSLEFNHVPTQSSSPPARNSHHRRAWQHLWSWLVFSTGTKGTLLSQVPNPGWQPPLSRLGGPGWESGTTGVFHPGQITCFVVVTGFQTDGVSYVMAPSARLPNQGCAEPCRSLIVPRVDTQVLDCLKTWFISATTSIQDGRLPHSAICMLMIP